MKEQRGSTGVAVDVDDVATPRPLYPQKRDTVPIVQEAGWTPGPV
jgi:hypothetical protein